MAVNVDPFIHPIPKKILSDPDLRPFFEYFVRWAHDMWRRTGGGDDEVSDTGLRETYPWMQEFNADNFEKMAYNVENITNNEFSYPVEVETKTLTTKTISSETYTAVDNMFINATNDSTLIMPENPERDSLIYFSKDSTGFTLRPNGKKVNGTLEDIKFYKNRLARQVWYFIDADEWFFI